MIRLSPEGDGGLVARLESRVEQQSTLIAMMKQRLDDTLRELQEVRGLCEQHMAEAQAVSQQLAEESGARELVEERFRQLVYNHEEMIKIKDEYKSTCIQLRKELAGSSERDREEVAAVQSELQGVREGRRDAEARCVELEAGLRDLTAQHETACAEAVKYKQKVEAFRTAVEEAHCKHREGVGVWERQTELLTQQLADREAEVTCKDERVCALTSQLEQAKIELQIAQRKFQLQANEVNTDKEVVRLRAEVQQEREKNGSLDTEFVAYRKHSSQLLAQEREINHRLRHLD